MRLSDICKRKCPTIPECAKDPKPGENVCTYGMTFIAERYDEQDVIVFGVRGPTNPNSAAPHLKQFLKGRAVAVTDVKEWLQRLDTLRRSIEDDFQSRKREMLEPLHDPQRMAKQIHNIAANMVQSVYGPGRLEDLVDRADTNLKSLVRATELLEDSFEQLIIYFNPQAALFGERTLGSIHGLLTKLVSVLGIQNTGGGAVKLHLNGSCYRQVHLYESFRLLPFALITNAIKYSLQGPVKVDILEQQTAISISVTSIGPLIEKEELGKIFERGFRGKWATAVAKGSGVGLFLAKAVADAHDTRVRVASNPLGRQSAKGIPLAENRFSFELAIGLRT